MLGAVDEGDQGGQRAEDLPYGEVVERGDVGQGLRLLFKLAAGRGHGAFPSLGGESPWSVLRAAARRCVPGSLALQRVKFTDFLASMVVAKGHSVQV